MFVQMGLKGRVCERERTGSFLSSCGSWKPLLSVLIFYLYSLMMETKLTNLFINPESFSFVWKTDTNYDFSFILDLLRILLQNSTCTYKFVIFRALCLHSVSSKAFLMLPFHGVANSSVSSWPWACLISSILPTILHLLLLCDSRRKFTEKNNKEKQVFKNWSLNCWCLSKKAIFGLFWEQGKFRR